MESWHYNFQNHIMIAHLVSLLYPVFAWFYLQFIWCIGPFFSYIRYYLTYKSPSSFNQVMLLVWCILPLLKKKKNRNTIDSVSLVLNNNCYFWSIEYKFSVPACIQYNFEIFDQYHHRKISIQLHFQVSLFLKTKFNARKTTQSM